MWICRHCAAHVADDVLQCPCCGQSAPARLQPHLAENISAEMNGARRLEDLQRPVIRGLGPYQLNWYRKPAGFGAFFGLVLGLWINIETRTTSDYYVFLFLLAGAGALLFVAVTYLLLNYFHRRQTILPSDAALRTTDSLGHKAPLSEAELADKITQGAERISTPREPDDDHIITAEKDRRPADTTLPGDNIIQRPISVLLSILCFAGWDPAPAAESARLPHVIVILVDDLGSGDLACCGAADMRTPHLDRFFSAGMRLDRFYANSSVCSPTRASLLTGRYPDLVGVPGVIRTQPENNWGQLRPDAVLLPKLLREAGYRTALIGKWHLGLTSPNLPNERGFDHFQGFLGDMMDDYRTHLRHGKNYLRHNDQEIQPAGHATDLFTTWACDFLSRQKAERPFFLYLAYNAPHAPIQPPPQWLEKVKKRQPDLDAKRAKLVALIEHLDDGIGKVLQTLKTTGLDRNTLVLFASDNGGPLELGAKNGSLRGGKGSMYEGGLRVPLAAVWPGRIKPDSRSQRLGLSMDIFPTILEAAGVAYRGERDGVSFLPALLGKKEAEAERTMFFTRREGGPAFGGKTIDAVRRGDWKLLQNSPFGPLELYNLRTDPAENYNLVATERKKVQELSTVLQAHLQQAGAVPWQPAKR